MFSHINPFTSVPPAPIQEEQLVVGDPLPPSALLPASSSSVPQLAQPPPVWPFSDSRIVLYFDSFSPKVRSLQITLERRALSLGLSPSSYSTTDINRASHVVLDPEFINDNLTLRSQALPRRVVSVQWLVDSFLEEEALPEDDYDLSTPVEEPSKEQEVEVVEEEGGARSASDFVAGVFRVKGWLHEEEDKMAQFLASDPRRDGDIESTWKAYRRGSQHPYRSVSAYKQHYSLRKELHFGSQIAMLRTAANGGFVVQQGEEEEKIKEDPVAPTRLDANYVNGYATPKGWLVEEEADMARFLASKPQRNEYGTIWEQYQRTHPSRSHSAYRTHHLQVRKDQIEVQVASFIAANHGQPIVYEHPEVVETRPEKNKGFREARPKRQRATAYGLPVASSARAPWTWKEDRDLCQLLAGQEGTRNEKFRLFVKKYPLRTLSACQGHFDYNEVRIRQEIEAIKRRRGSTSRRKKDNSFDLGSVQKPATTGTSSRKLPFARPSSKKSFTIEKLSRHPQPTTNRKVGSQSSLLDAVASRSTSASSGNWSRVERKELIPRDSSYRSSKRRRISLPDQPLKAVASSSNSHRLILSLPRTIYSSSNASKCNPFGSSFGPPLTTDGPFPPSSPLTNAVASSSRSHRLSLPSSRTIYSGPRPSHQSTPTIQLTPASKALPPSPPSPANAVASSSRSSLIQHDLLPSTSLSSSHVFNPMDTISSRSLPSQPLPPLPAPHTSPQSDDDEEDRLEPLSFLVLGSKPSTCSPTSPFCYLCGEDGSPTYNTLHLVGKDRTRREEPACDVCEDRVSKTRVKAERLGLVGEEKEVWVTDVLVEKGVKQRREWVFGREGKKRE